MREILGLELTDDQGKVADDMVGRKEVAVKSGHGVGKSCLAAAASLWFKYSFEPSVVLTTAPTERQVKEILWREIRYRKSRSLEPLPGKVMTMKIDVDPINYMLGFSTKEVQQIQGFHSPHIMVVVDEANGYPEELWQALEGLLSGGAKTLLFMIGNPINPIGRFYNSFSNPDVGCHTISCLSHPNYITGKNIVPGAVTRDWVEAKRKLWGEDSIFWSTRVIGEFPKSAADMIVSLDWVELAENKESIKSENEVLYMGADFAEYGDDDNVWTIGTATRLIDVIARQKIEPAEAGHFTCNLIERFGINPVNCSLDGIGVGAGVYSQVKEKYEGVRRFVASESASKSKIFADRGIEAWWNVRDMLNPESARYAGYAFGKKVDRVKADLCTRKYLTDRNNKIALEPKPIYRKKLKRSPDFGDSFTICYSKLVDSGIYGIFSMPDVI